MQPVKRVRSGGSRWLHAICITDYHQKAKELFVHVLPDRKKQTMTPQVMAYAANSRCVIRSDGYSASKDLAKNCRHEVCNHKKAWVSPEGFHTNTVESMNSGLKRELKRRYSRLGNSDEQRTDRAQFFAEQVNGKLKNGDSEGKVMRRHFVNLQIFCELVVVPKKPVIVVFSDEEDEKEQLQDPSWMDQDARDIICLGRFNWRQTRN